ncbi:hypothetical protein KIPB_012423, partial [Kipferlia bialata]
AEGKEEDERIEFFVSLEQLDTLRTEVRSALLQPSRVQSQAKKGQEKKRQ